VSAREAYLRALIGGSRMATHGATTLREYLRMLLREYLRMLMEYMVRGLAGQIQYPTLIMGDQADPIAAQARQLYDALEYPKEFILFTEEKKKARWCPLRGPGSVTLAIIERTTGWPVSLGRSRSRPVRRLRT
jgi:hypothetical protein